VSPVRAESRQMTVLHNLQLHFKTVRGKHRAEPSKLLACASPALFAEGEEKHPTTHQPLAGETAWQDLNTGMRRSTTRDTQSHQGDPTKPTAAFPKGRDQVGQSRLHEQRLTSSSALGFSK